LPSPDAILTRLALVLYTGPKGTRTMPSTVNGVGTKYCGRRAEEADGSYVTTEFVVVGHIPLVPLRSWRVRPSGPVDYSHWDRGWGSYESTESQRFQVHRVPLDWSQVRQVYVGVLAFFVAIILAVVWLGLLYGLVFAATAAQHDRQVLFVFLIIVVVGSGALIGQRLIRRGRRLTRHTPHEDLSLK
jgi:hypothetical protein